MVALILAAGYGTRLYPLTKETPKALLPVGGRPILDHLIEKLEPPGLQPERFLLVSNHKYAEPFRKWAAGRRWTAPAEVLDDGSASEEDRLGSVGDLAFAIRRGSLQEKELLVLGGDNLFRDDLVGLVRFARQKAPGVTLGAYELPDRSAASRYGVLTLREEDRRLLDLEEKPAHPASGWVSTAIYFFPPSAVRWVLEYVGSRRTADTLGPFVQWLITRESVFAYPLRGPWFDIGDVAAYTQAQESFA